MTILGAVMARKRTVRPDDLADGSVLAENLCRLGYCEQVVKATEIAKLVTERTGKTMSRQRIANLLNSVRITETTLETIAEALGVDVAELRRRDWRAQG
jgi:transcriptional regulator with XRE-family HTH domain